MHNPIKNIKWMWRVKRHALDLIEGSNLKIEDPFHLYVRTVRNKKTPPTVYMQAWSKRQCADKLLQNHIDHLLYTERVERNQREALARQERLAKRKNQTHLKVVS